MSRPANPEATELGAPRKARHSSGARSRPTVDLDNPLAVAKRAESVAANEDWRARWAAMHLSVDEVRAIARLAWAASFVVITAEPIGDMLDAGAAIGTPALRAEFADALSNFIPRFLGPLAASEMERNVSAPDASAKTGETSP